MHLRAEMPGSESGTHGRMEVRIARKVAALCGIPATSGDGHDAGAGEAWLADFQALTTTEIALGGPTSTRSRPGTLRDSGVFERIKGEFVHRRLGKIKTAPIPNVVLSDYGPDTKSALVLAGVNTVLEPVQAAVIAAMEDIRVQVDDDAAMLVAVGQCMLQEVFAAQPFLLLSGIQAGRIQRTLSLPPIARNATEVARMEYGWPRPELKHRPLEVDVISRLWDHLAAHGDVYKKDGSLRARETDFGPYLRGEPIVGYEQNEPVAVNGGAVLRTRLVANLRNASEGLLIGSNPGLPHCTISVVERAGGPAYAEVAVPRQRQIEVMLANLSGRLSPLRPNNRPEPGQVLKLPRIEVSAWRGTDVLHRRAALLAHYYSLRAAGWISGMTALNRRRNRDECARRCTDLLVAAEALLDPGDPLRDQLAAFVLSYRQQYEASFGLPSPDLPALLDTLKRMADRVRAGQPGRAELVEMLPIVLSELKAALLAASLGVRAEPSAADLVPQIERWWETARELRRELAIEVDETPYPEYEFVAYLLSDHRDHKQLLRGLDMMPSLLDHRERAARAGGRTLSVRSSYGVYLRGLSQAINQRIDPSRTAEWVQKAFMYAETLGRHAETERIFDQRTKPIDGGRPTYDGAAMLLLVTLAGAWVTVAASGILSDDPQRHAEKYADDSVDRMNEYLSAVRERGSTDTKGNPASQVDHLRAAMAAEVNQRWIRWRAVHRPGHAPG